MKSNGRDFCVLDMRVGRKLNGIRKEQGIVELPKHLQLRLEQILPQGGGRKKDLVRLLNLPFYFRGQLKDVVRDIENQAGPLATDFFEQIRLMKSVEEFYKLIRLAMQDNLKKPNLRFKVLIDNNLPPKFYDLLTELLVNENMDVVLEVMQIYFLDEIIEQCAEEYPVLQEISFKLRSEMIVHPLASVWQ